MDIEKSILEKIKIKEELKDKLNNKIKIIGNCLNDKLKGNNKKDKVMGRVLAQGREEKKLDLDKQKENMNLINNKFNKVIGETGDNPSPINDKINIIEKKLKLVK